MSSYPEKVIYLLCLLVLSLAPVSLAEIDKTRYITIDEIEPGMKGYCLTVYEGREIEKFDIVVLAVARNFEPGRDAIMVKGTDPRFEHTGPVAGCSGSPVFLDGRNAGALAFGWMFSKDALYGVTPIEEMLDVGTATDAANSATAMNATRIDFSSPFNFQKISELYTKHIKAASPAPENYKPLSIPLSTSMPEHIWPELRNLFPNCNLVPIAAAGNSASTQKEHDSFKPGGVISVPLVAGDISLAATGTVTAVEADRVYAFGHSFMGIGPVSFPMTTGTVHTVVASLYRSFKFSGSDDKILGTITADQSAAIRGTIGDVPNMIKMTARIDNFLSRSPKTFNFSVTDDRFYAPLLTQLAISSAAVSKGDLPMEHTIEYQAVIKTEGIEPITMKNISSNAGFREAVGDMTGPIYMFMNNPYSRPKIESLECSIKITPENSTAALIRANVHDNQLELGETVNITLVLKPYLKPEFTRQISFEIPQDIQPGQYQIQISGDEDYYKFLAKAAPQKISSHDLPSMVQAIRRILKIKRNKLYVTMALKPSGITLDYAELADLPMSKSMMLVDPKRSIKARPYQDWLEKELESDLIIQGSQTVTIEVENKK
jgi:hypothetical protein